MDKIDRKIVNLLQTNARASLKELSKACFISSPAIAARITKLEKAGIITGYHANIDMEKIGFHVKAFIQVQLEPRQKEEFYPYIQSIPNVIECNCVTGDYSEIMEVVFPSTTNLMTSSISFSSVLAKLVPRLSSVPVSTTAASLYRITSNKIYR